jgi:hypothetical protein
MLRLVPQGKKRREIRVRDNVWTELAKLSDSYTADATRVLQKVFQSDLDDHFHPIAGVPTDAGEITYGAVLGQKIVVWIRKSLKFWDIVSVFVISDVVLEAKRGLVALEDFFFGGLPRKLLIWRENVQTFGVGFLNRLPDKLAFEGKYYRFVPEPDAVMALQLCGQMNHEVSLA